MIYLIRNNRWKINERYNIDKILYLLVDRPDDIHAHGLCWWDKDKKEYRNYKLPSYAGSFSGTVYWKDRIIRNCMI